MELDLGLDGLSIWVRGRPFPDATDFHDANWLELRATMQRGRTSVTTEGAILMTTDFERFRDQLVAMYESVSDEAVLCGYEPDLKVTLGINRLGHISGQIEITPDQLNEFHSFDIGGWDQTNLPALIASCDAIVHDYPVLNRPDP